MYDFINRRTTTSELIWPGPGTPSSSAHKRRSMIGGSDSQAGNKEVERDLYIGSGDGAKVPCRLPVRDKHFKVAAGLRLRGFFDSDAVRSRLTSRGRAQPGSEVV